MFPSTIAKPALQLGARTVTFTTQEVGTLIQQLAAGITAISISFACIVAMGVVFPSGAAAAAARSRLAVVPDLAVDFRALAQQRPWTCAEQNVIDVPTSGWAGGVAECAWQDRLRMRRWSGSAVVGSGACVSSQAKWWAWARSVGSATAPAAWRSTWAAQSIIDEREPEKRIVILRYLLNGEWSVTEWRWKPSTRAATRHWQEGRWKLLAGRAAQLRAPVEAPQGPLETRMLRSVLEANLGDRVGEIGNQTLQWQAGGLCLSVDALGLEQQIMQLPYAVDDSRLEQRAAMQLQLARRYPKATWLTGFSLIPAPRHARGGAKFYAVWIEHAILKGQVWIPTKGNGPLVRLRITTALPAAAAGQPDPQSAARAAQVMQRELTGLASRWALEHE